MEILQPVIAILTVLGLLGASLLILRKTGRAQFGMRAAGSGAKRLEVLERVPLGPQHTLHLVRVGERCLLIATSPASCQMLEEFHGTEGKR